MSVKPQIINFDNRGYHNEDLTKTATRLIETGSWKKQRVVVIVPSASTIAAKVAFSQWSLIFPPNQAVHRMLALGCEVGDAYSNAIGEILNHPDLSQWEFVLTMEADNMPPADGLVKLIGHMEMHPEYACIGGLYFCKGPGGCAHIWGDVKDPQQNFRPQVPVPGQLVECVGTSMGFNLWRMSMFKDTRLRRPWFKTLNGSEGQGVGTQDLYAWGDLRKYGYRCAVACDVLVGHHDLTGAFGVPDFVW
jgi:hypothetical protein